MVRCVPSNFTSAVGVASTSRSRTNHPCNAVQLRHSGSATTSQALRSCSQDLKQVSSPPKTLSSFRCDLSQNGYGSLELWVPPGNAKEPGESTTSYCPRSTPPRCPPPTRAERTSWSKTAKILIEQDNANPGRSIPFTGKWFQTAVIQLIRIRPVKKLDAKQESEHAPSG